MWQQHLISLQPKARGFHLVTREIEAKLPELADFSIGFAHLFLQHTSASLTVNENADVTVRQDFETHINTMVPENMPYYRHTLEGPDDMPAHIKSSMLGCSVLLPITQGRFNLGTWQGIYLGEHRNDAGARRIVVTLQGD